MKLYSFHSALAIHHIHALYSTYAVIGGYIIPWTRANAMRISSVQLW